MASDQTEQAKDSMSQPKSSGSITIPGQSTNEKKTEQKQYGMLGEQKYRPHKQLAFPDGIGRSIRD